MNPTNHFTLFLVTLLANAMTMIIMIVAAIKRPTWRYRLIGLVAVGAFIASLHQVVTGKFTLPASVLTTLLVMLITAVAVQNVLSSRR